MSNVKRWVEYGPFTYVGLPSSSVALTFSLMVIARSSLDTLTTFWKGLSPSSSRGSGGRTRMTTLKFFEGPSKLPLLLLALPRLDEEAAGVGREWLSIKPPPPPTTPPVSPPPRCLLPPRSSPPGDAGGIKPRPRFPGDREYGRV